MSIIMITVSVTFGWCNSYTIDIPENKMVGTLAVHLLSPIRKTNTDILYFILNGQLVGKNMTDLDTELGDFGLPSKQYMAHFIFKDPKTQYNDSVLATSKRINSWIKKHTNEQVSESINSTLSRLVGAPVTLTLSNLIDEVVLIPAEEYENYVVDADADDVSPQDNCSICAETLGDGPYSKIINCNHIFHANCIREHLVTQGSVRCPTCAQDVRGD